MQRLCMLGCLIAAGSLMMAPATGGVAVPSAQIETQVAATDLSAAKNKPVRKSSAASRRAPRGETGDVGRDTVGSTGGPGHGYNRVSNQPNASCVIDLGYGRTRPC